MTIGKLQLIKPMKVKIIFAWYDLWVGAFYDQDKHRWYLLPFPTLGIVIDLPQWCRVSNLERWRQRKLYERNVRIMRKKHKKIITEFFHELNWNNDDIMNLTYCCGCLNDAVRVLTCHILDRVECTGYNSYEVAEALVREGFDRSWKPLNQ